MKIIFDKDIALSNEAVDSVSTELYSYFSEYYKSIKLKNGSKIALKLRLSLEEVLLQFKSISKEEECPCHIFVQKKHSKFSIIISSQGKKTDVFDNENEDEFNEILNSYSMPEISRQYFYKNNRNIVQFNVIAKAEKSMLKIITAIVSGAVLSELLLILSKPAAAAVNQYLVSPFLSTVLTLLSIFAMNMIFLNIICGVINMKNISFIKETGLKIINHALIRDVITVILSIILFEIIFEVTDKSLKVEANSLGQISELIFGIFPQNILEPFIQKNALQIMLMGFFFGGVLVVLGNKVSGLVKIIQQLNLFSVKTVSIICKLSPLMIFLSISKLLLDGSISLVKDSWFLLVINAAGYTLYVIISFIIISRKTGIKIREFILDTLPVALTGFSTSSSTACIQQNFNLLTGKYGVDEKKYEMIHPIFQMFFDPTFAICIVGYSFYACKINNVSLSIISLIINAVIIMFLVVASPPVSGGLFVVISLLFTSLGLPQEALIVIISLDTVFDMLRTGFKQFVYVPEILVLSKKI